MSIGIGGGRWRQFYCTAVIFDISVILLFYEIFDESQLLQDHPVLGRLDFPLIGVLRLQLRDLQSLDQIFITEHFLPI